MNLGEILGEVCREKDLDKNKYELRHPGTGNFVRSESAKKRGEFHFRIGRKFNKAQNVLMGIGGLGPEDFLSDEISRTLANRVIVDY